MSEFPPELIEKMRKSNEEYSKIKSLIEPLGFHLCSRSIYFGEGVCSIYCGKSEDYQKIIDNLSNINDIAPNVSYNELREIIINRTQFATVEECRTMSRQLSFYF